MERRSHAGTHRHDKVVSLSATKDILLSDARASLERTLASLDGRNDVDEAFAVWLAADGADAARRDRLIQESAKQMASQHNYRYVAAMGYATAAKTEAGETVEDAHREALRAGLGWLAGRPALVEGMPMGFVGDSLALLGVALGARCLADEAVRYAIAHWLSGFVEQSYQMRSVQSWQQCLFVAAGQTCGAAVNIAFPTDAAVADVRVALRFKGILLTSDENLVATDECDALRLLQTTDSSRLEAPNAALRAAALDWIRRSAPVLTPDRATPADVARLLRGIQSSLLHWTWEHDPKTSRRGAQARKWHLDHEYHVQNLLWAVLAPVFPDLEAEFYTPAIGPKRPRADIGIPSLKLIIEAKFMRHDERPQAMVDQVAADASLYLVEGSGYTDIIAFIWDDGRRTETHANVKQGLQKINGVLDTVIVARPGMMEERTPSATAQPAPATTQTIDTPSNIAP